MQASRYCFPAFPAICQHRVFSQDFQIIPRFRDVQPPVQSKPAVSPALPAAANSGDREFDHVRSPQDAQPAQGAAEREAGVVPDHAFGKGYLVNDIQNPVPQNVLGSPAREGVIQGDELALVCLFYIDILFAGLIFLQKTQRRGKQLAGLVVGNLFGRPGFFDPDICLHFLH